MQLSSYSSISAEAWAKVPARSMPKRYGGGRSQSRVSRAVYLRRVLLWQDSDYGLQFGWQDGPCVCSALHLSVG